MAQDPTHFLNSLPIVMASYTNSIVTRISNINSLYQNHSAVKSRMRVNTRPRAADVWVLLSEHIQNSLKVIKNNELEISLKKIQKFMVCEVKFSKLMQMNETELMTSATVIKLRGSILNTSKS